MLVLAVAVLGAARPSDAAQPPDWRSDWAVADGFSLQRDSLGYDFPTAIAFVPHPGPAPDDPLYFVAELRGAIKVVTNDRTVHTFVEDFFALQPTAELPSGSGEVGLAGICLAPEQGYVFATFAYQDAAGILRNNIVRFESAPGTFGLAPIAQTDFSQTFAADESSTSHQIGSCQVAEDGLLYVGVGDGHQIDRSQEIDSTLGKVLRMTLDGDPVDDNPFRRDEDRKTPQNYVWAMGFRNPFGLQVLTGRVFVADNGLNIDRLVAAEAGGNYLWNGSDWSTGSNAAFTMAPSVGVVQMATMGEATAGFPSSYRDSFFVALSGNLPWTANADAQRPPGVIAIPYDFTEDRLAAVPDYVLRYVGDGVQMVAGVAGAGRAVRGSHLSRRRRRKRGVPAGLGARPGTPKAPGQRTGCRVFDGQAWLPRLPQSGRQRRQRRAAAGSHCIGSARPGTTKIRKLLANPGRL
ncbi:MAG: PQQ-dependent sugar dehydrogenase [Caldilineales bacterium]